jgi:hypothetical protein
MAHVASPWQPFGPPPLLGTETSVSAPRGASPAEPGAGRSRPLRRTLPMETRESATSRAGWRMRHGRLGEVVNLLFPEVLDGGPGSAHRDEPVELPFPGNAFRLESPQLGELDPGSDPEVPRSDRQVE